MIITESNNARLRSKKYLLPDFFDIIVSFLISVFLLFVGNINVISSFLKISREEKQDFISYLSNGFTVFSEILADFSFSAIIVTFVINFFIAYTIVSTIFYAKDLYKSIKSDLKNSGAIQSNNFWRHVLFYGFKKMFLTIFIIFWALLFIFYLLPLGIMSGSIYLKDSSEISNIFYLLIGVAIIFIGVLSVVMYSKYKLVYRSTKTPI